MKTLNDELLPGSAMDKITPETLVCPRKQVQCPYFDGVCAIYICWVGLKRLAIVRNQSQGGKIE